MSNPIIHREFIGLLRSKLALAFQVVFVCLMAGLVFFRWPGGNAVDLAAKQSSEVLRIFGYGMMVSLVLLAPIFPATSIVKELRRGTLLLLINSPLGPAAIFLGKLVGALGFVLLLVILSLPAAAACYAMGGLNLHSQFLPLYLVLVFMAIEYATLGLLVSTFAATPESSVRLVYMTMVALTVIPVAAARYGSGYVLDYPAAARALDWLQGISPLPAVMEILGNSDLSEVSATRGSEMALRAVVCAVAMTILFSFATITRLNTRLFDRARATGKVTDDRSAWVQAFRRVMFLWFFDPQRRTQLIGNWSNPVMFKEMRSRRFGRIHWTLRLAVVSLIVSLGLMLMVSRKVIDSNVGTISSVVVFLQIGLIVLLTPTLACGLISGERESGGWPLLQMTPLSAGAIIRGKLLSVAVPLGLILLGTLPAYGVMWYIEAVQQSAVPQVIITLLLTCVVAVMVGAAASSLVRRTAEATALAFAVLVGLWGGTLLLWTADGNPLPHWFVEAALKLNPLATALTLLRAPNFDNYDLKRDNWWLMIGIALICTLILVLRTRRLTRPE